MTDEAIEGWVSYKPGLSPGLYEVQGVEEGIPFTVQVELLSGPSEQRNDGWQLSPYASVLRVRRLPNVSYPPVGTRVRWTSRGVTREGVIDRLAARVAHPSHCSFNTEAAFGSHPPLSMAIPVVRVDWTSNGGLKGADPPYFYRPRPQWLEVVETGEGG